MFSRVNYMLIYFTMKPSENLDTSNILDVNVNILDDVKIFKIN